MRKLTVNTVTVKILDNASDLTAVVGGQRPRPNPNPHPRPSRGPGICLPSLGCTASPE